MKKKINKKQISKKKKSSSSSKYIKVIATASLVCIVGFFAYKTVCQIVDLTQTAIDKIGFTVSNVYIKEKGIPPPGGIVSNIPIKKGDSMSSISINEICKKVAKIPWVKDVTVHKGLPNIISIFVTYKKAIAVFQQNSNFSIIDEDGHDIIPIKQNDVKKGTVIIAGDGAREKASQIIATISKHKFIYQKLNSIVFVRKRRFDIIISGGILVKLPDHDIESSLNTLEILLKHSGFNKNTVKSIDMRLQDKIIMSGINLSKDSDTGRKRV